MNPHHAQHNEHERLTQLLLDRALQGLDGDEAAELHALAGDGAALNLEIDPGGFEAAAALAAIAMIGAAEALPDSLRDRLHVHRDAWMRDRPTAFAPGFASESAAGTLPPTVRSTGGSMRMPAPPASPATLNASPMRTNRSTAWGGWFAAAACLAIALLAWLPRLNMRGESSPAELRAALIAGNPADLVQWAWANPTNDPNSTNLEGDVVWSDAEQKGYMRFKGLARNDPAREQYQLWIFDKDRKADYPVDGGVFDITADGEVVIPIDAKLRVFDAGMFAVTVEKPGGVARSDRERIPALAKPAE